MLATIAGNGAAANQSVVAAEAAHAGMVRRVTRIVLSSAFVNGTFLFETPAATPFLGPFHVPAGQGTVQIDLAGGRVGRAGAMWHADAALVVDVTVPGADNWSVLVEYE